MLEVGRLRVVPISDGLLEEPAGGGHPFTAAHFPGLGFGRLLRGQGRRFVAAG